jgi:hypothetical protein
MSDFLLSFKLGENEQYLKGYALGFRAYVMVSSGGRVNDIDRVEKEAERRLSLRQRWADESTAKGASTR